MCRKWLFSPLFSAAFCHFLLLLTCCAPGESDPTTVPRPTETVTFVFPTAPPATHTPTPTPSAGVPQMPTPTATPPESACAGLDGALEMSVLVGPSDAVGLEPVAVGQIPLSASGTADPYAISGNGLIDYAATLEKEWGSYAVTLNMEGVISGTCSGAPGMETLDLMIDVSGDQLVVVTAEGFQAEYPWNGTHNFQLAFPVASGAAHSGEGWTFTLLLNSE
jgi:hypothetical protein